MGCEISSLVLAETSERFIIIFSWRDLSASTPDGGALCYVLRTGAYSFQGDLRRTIDFGSHGIRDDSKDSGAETLPAWPSLTRKACAQEQKNGRSATQALFRRSSDGGAAVYWPITARVGSSDSL